MTVGSNHFRTVRREPEVVTAGEAVRTIECSYEFLVTPVSVVGWVKPEVRK